AVLTLKAETGVALLLIDKSLKELTRVADRAVILERGRTVWAGATDALTADITERYVGV
ncbi:MAG: ABC transporter ATP-binding protein, partial [Pseudomonadota bacterium]